MSGKKAAVEKLKLYFCYGRPNLLSEEDWDDVHVISGLLKLFFRELPDPVLTFALYDEWIDAINRPPAEQASHLLAVLKKLPKINYETLKVMIAHLKRVAESSDVNKMKIDNVSIVFGPTLMRSKIDDDFSHMSSQCNVIEALILQYDYFFGTST